MKFTRKDTPTIMDGMVVRYECGDFEINASRNGVSTNGWMPRIKEHKDIECVQDVLNRAFWQYLSLNGRDPKVLTEERMTEMMWGPGMEIPEHYESPVLPEARAEQA